MDIKDGLLQFFNVDHGACALLTMPATLPMKAWRVLIDCGHSSDRNGFPWHPAVHLASMGIKHVDLLICTNYDEDHASGIPKLVEHGVSIGCILGNPTVTPEAIDQLKTEDGMGVGIRIIMNTLVSRRDAGKVQTPPVIPGLDLSWFWNPYPHWDSENNLSLVAHLSIHGWNFLFPGDLETDGWKNMLRLPSFAALMPGIDVLVAAHHGRKSGVCEALFDLYGCSPTLVVISDCAEKHQSQETVPYYRSKARGIQSYREGGPRFVLTTRSDDEIWFVFDGGRCTAN